MAQPLPTTRIVAPVPTWESGAALPSGPAPKDGTSMHGSRTSAVSLSPPRSWSPASRRLAAWGAGLLLAAGLIVAVASTWRISRHFPTAPYPQPSRLYGRIQQLVPGALCNLAPRGGQPGRGRGRARAGERSGGDAEPGAGGGHRRFRAAAWRLPRARRHAERR